MTNQVLSENKPLTPLIDAINMDGENKTDFINHSVNYNDDNIY